MTKKTAHKSLPARGLNWVAKQFGYELAPKGEQNSSLNRFFRMMGLTYSWGDWTLRKYVEHGYMGNADIYSIVNRITRTAACAPFRVYRIKDKKKHLKYKAWTGERSTIESIQKAMLIKESTYEEDENHPMNALLKNPNNYQGANEFVQTCIGFKLITGNRFLFINKLDAGANKGKPHGLYNLPPQHMTIKAGGKMFEVIEYILNCGWYTEIPKEYVIHSRYWNPNYDMAGSHLWGLSPLKAASKTLERSNKAEERGVIMLDNAGAAGVLFNKSGTDDEDSVERMGQMKKKINEEVLGVENAGAIVLANGDLGYLNFGLTAEQMTLIEQEKFGIERFANIYAVPPGLFMASANATDNNIKAWNKQLITQACLPALSDLRDDLNQVAAMYGDEIYVDYDISVFPELQEDLEKVAKIFDRWCFTGNETRLALGYDEDSVEPMMKKYLIRGTWQEINNLNPDLLDDELTDAEREAAIAGRGENANA